MKAKEAEDWLKSKTWLSEQPTPPPRALIDLVDKMHRKALRLVRLPKPRLPAFADLGSLKAKVERQLEAACKAIVKKRDLKDGWGNCISCKKNSNRLQWGHFIPQHKSPWLRFDPRNTAMQCAECNGPGHGMTFEYGQALNARENDPSFAEQLKQEAKRKASWIPSLPNLEEKLKELRAQLEAMP